MRIGNQKTESFTFGICSAVLIYRTDNVEVHAGEVHRIDQTDSKPSFLGEEILKKCPEFRFGFDKFGMSVYVFVTRA